MKPLGSFKFLNNSIKIQISHKDLSAIKHLVAIAPQEAQWFHRLEVINKPSETTYRIYDMFIPEQVCSATQVESSDSMMIDFYRELLREHGPEETNTIMQSMNVWCHSHHNMSPSPSGQDNKQFMEFIKYNIDAGSKVPQIMLIFNKKDQFYSRIFDPSTGYICENVSIEVETEDFSWINEAAKKKFKKPAPRKLADSFKNMRQQTFGFQKPTNSSNKKKQKPKSTPLQSAMEGLGFGSIDQDYYNFWRVYSDEFDQITELMKEVFSSNTTNQKAVESLFNIAENTLQFDKSKVCALLDFLNSQDDCEDVRAFEDAYLEYSDSEYEDAKAAFYSVLETGTVDDMTLTHTIYLVYCLYPNVGFYVEDAADREKLIDWWLIEGCGFSEKPSNSSGLPFGSHLGGDLYQDYLVDFNNPY